MAEKKVKVKASEYASEMERKAYEYWQKWTNSKDDIRTIPELLRDFGEYILNND